MANGDDTSAADGGETRLDRFIEPAADVADDAASAIPGVEQGDKIQQAEQFLQEQARAQRQGRGAIPSAGEAEEALRPAGRQVATALRASSPAALIAAEGDTSVQAPEDTGVERLGVGSGRRVAETANPAAVTLGAGKIGESVGEFGFNLAANQQRAGQQLAAAGEAGQTLIDDTIEGIQKRPVQTAGSALTEAAFLGAGALASPVRATKATVPLRSSSASKLAKAAARSPSSDGPSTTVRGLRLQTPKIAEAAGVTPRASRTIAGARGLRPSRGAPTVDVGDVDLQRLGGDKGNTGPVFEPIRQFETEVFVGSAGTAPDAPIATKTAGRAGIEEGLPAVQGLIREGRGTAGSVDLDAEQVARAAEEIPDDAAPAVADALRETDATVFGSGAVKAQEPGFRNPGDIDIVVQDKEAAKATITEQIEGTDAEISAFDIKEAEDFAGLERGEAFGFGERSRAPVRGPTGVRFNPIGEELGRKAGASGFLREEGELSAELDLGPRANPGGAPRTKDVEDALAIGEELLGESDPAVQRFRSSFGPGTSGVDADTGAIAADAPIVDIAPDRPPLPGTPAGLTADGGRDIEDTVFPPERRDELNVGGRRGLDIATDPMDFGGQKRLGAAADPADPAATTRIGLGETDVDDILETSARRSDADTGAPPSRTASPSSPTSPSPGAGVGLLASSPSVTGDGPSTSVGLGESPSSLPTTPGLSPSSPVVGSDTPSSLLSPSPGTSSPPSTSGTPSSPPTTSSPPSSTSAPPSTSSPPGDTGQGTSSFVGGMPGDESEPPINTDIDIDTDDAEPEEELLTTEFSFATAEADLVGGESLLLGDD